MDFEIFKDNFFEIAALLAIAVFVGFVGRKARQPLIVSFIAVTSYTGRTAKQLEKAGADLVLLPFADAADKIPEKLKSLKRPFSDR